jgi:glycosyltransferase involved in cell wall biosynthesis
MQCCNNSRLAISVVICTYNRAELIASALQSLCEQTINKSHYEIIVVDNNSKDNTRAVTEKFCRGYPNIRYFFEMRQGLSHARNRGWQEAKGLYVAYIDDECWVPALWIEVANEITERLSPAVFGGPYFGYYKSAKPHWWKENYGTFEHSKTARALIRGEYVRGGNIIIRRCLLDKIGGFDSRYGMSGQKLGYGEETGLQRRIRAIMPKELIYYDPKLYLYHLVRLKKMSLRWGLCSHFIGGRYSYSVFRDNTNQKDELSRFKLLAQAVLTMLKLFADILICGPQRNRKRYPYLQNYLYENTFNYVKTLGFIYERYIHTIRI